MSPHPPSPAPDERLLKVTAVAERIDASKATVYRLVHAGRLGAHFIGTGKRPRVRISETALAKFIRESAS